MAVGWIAGLVGFIEESRGSSKLAAAAFFIVALVVPNFFAEVINLLLVGIIVVYVISIPSANAVRDDSRRLGRRQLRSTRRGPPPTR